jgi:hypothetical protein
MAVEKSAALADFERARDEFLAAMEACPDEALTYLKKGDIYAIGGFFPHANWVLKHYLRVLERLAAGEAGFRTDDPAGEHEQANRRALAGLQPGERDPELAEVGHYHRRVLSVSESIKTEVWESKVDVFYGDAAEAFPTSPDDVLGWLRDHYREHVPQSADLLAEWRSAPTAAG